METIENFIPEGRLVDWISVIGALVSVFIAYKVYQLDKRVSDEGKPYVSIWFDNSYQSFEGIIGELTFINLGKESLPVRSIAYLFGNPDKRIQSAKASNIQNSTQLNNSENFQDAMFDVVFKENDIQKYILRSADEWPTQFRIRAMYYDNTFEFVEIDTSILGGKYTLKGRGRK